MEGRVAQDDLIGPRPEVKPANFRSRVRRRTAAAPRQPQRDQYAHSLLLPFNNPLVAAVVFCSCLCWQ